MCVIGARLSLVSRFEEQNGCSMTSIPFGVHAAQKVRANMNLAVQAKNANKHQKEEYSFNSTQNSDPTPSKYCDKMMNSIWGLYNRYSVHNFKSSTSSGYVFSQKSGQQSAAQDFKCPLDGFKLKNHQ